MRWASGVVINLLTFPELQRWLARYAVQPLDLALATGDCHCGQLVWLQRDFIWSDNVAAERQARRAGTANARSSFQTSLVVGDSRSVSVHGNFGSARLTSSSTSNVELKGTRDQFMLGDVAAIGAEEVELRPMAIATRLLPAAARA